jgi:hypothetical protein
MFGRTLFKAINKLHSQKQVDPLIWTATAEGCPGSDPQPISSRPCDARFVEALSYGAMTSATNESLIELVRMDGDSAIHGLELECRAALAYVGVDVIADRTLNRDGEAD